MRPPILDTPPGIAWLFASALLIGLAHPPFHLLAPSFVALVPLAVWLTRLPPGAEGRRSALSGGFLLGLVSYSLVLYWLFVALVFYTWTAVFAFLLPVLALSGLLALTVLAAHVIRTRLGCPLWLALPVLWTAAEWLRAHLGPFAFPWMGLGDTLTGFPWLAGAADVVGSRGLSFWLVLENTLLASVVLGLLDRRGSASAAGRRGRVLRPAVGALVLFLVPLVYSLYRWHTIELREAVRIAIVQPNVPAHLKLRGELADRRAKAAVDELLDTQRGIGVREADLVVLPETVLQTRLDPIPGAEPGRGTVYTRWLAGLAARTEAPILFGAIGSRDRGDGVYDSFNSAFLLAADGRWVGRYDKRRLVPVVEGDPWLGPPWLRSLGLREGFAAGAHGGPLVVDDDRFGVLICYESIFQGLSREYRLEGADFLVNLTNDAWFGRAKPWWSRTSALHQHPAHLVMRAIENRVGVARAANTGFSGVIDPLGRWRHRTALFVGDAFVAPVHTTDGVTAYARFGDVVGWLSAVAAAAAIVAGGSRSSGGEES